MFGFARVTEFAHTQATLRSSIILGAAALLLAGGAGAPAATGIGQVVGRDAPSLSPDGQSIVFTSFRNGKGELYVMNARGGDQRRLTTNNALDDLPSWSPDGSRIAFASNRDTGAKTSLYVMNADGTGVYGVTHGIWNETRPAWSPDGSLIAFQADRDPPVGNQEIYVVAPDGTGLRRLTTYPGKDDFPAWAPDGRSIAFARGPSPVTHEIYVMGADGRAVRQLTLPKLEAVALLWSPAQPIAGRTFEVIIGAAEVSGADIGALRIGCDVRLGGKPLRA